MATDDRPAITDHSRDSVSYGHRSSVNDERKMGSRIPRLAKNAIELIGTTPMVELPKISPRNGANIVAKLESLNPAGSVKDRVAWSVVGEAVKWHSLTLTMPADMSLERRTLLQRFGAEVILTPAIEGMTGAVFAAEELCREDPDYFMRQRVVTPA